MPASASSGECRDKPESRWRQIDAKRTLCDVRSSFCVKICEIAEFLLCCTGTRVGLYRYNHRGKSLAVPVQGSVSCFGRIFPRIHLRFQVAHACCFHRFPASILGVSARSPRRSVGSRRNLVHWILDCERIPRSPHLQFLDELGDRSRWSPRNPAASRVAEAKFAARKLHLRWVTSALLLSSYWSTCIDLDFVDYLTLASWSLIELDRDTLHTRLGSAHECHSGVRLVLLRWCRSCQLDLLSTDQLEWIEPDSRNGAGTGVFTVRGRVCLQSRFGLGQTWLFLQLSHRFRLLHRPWIRIEARASRVRALPDVLS
uniref:Uncharacterized protein n=1 Tax=Ananas comosus var. bracteatus TaxID=296719 RepID=A0A6V7NFB5_ANACO|nr:unnamed protein product [Ananas comosus var. bracteatus]